MNRLVNTYINHFGNVSVISNTTVGIIAAKRKIAISFIKIKN